MIGGIIGNPFPGSDGPKPRTGIVCEAAFAATPEKPTGVHSAPAKKAARIYEIATAPAEKPVKPRKIAPWRANSLLTGKQKAALSIDQRNAFAAQKDAGLIDDGADFEEWKHAETLVATGGKTQSLREATQEMANDIEAHFAAMIPNNPRAQARAFAKAMKGGAAEANHSLHMHQLEEACKRHGFGFPSYPAAICQSQYKVALSDATDAQLQNLFVKIQQRGRAKSLKARPPL